METFCFSCAIQLFVLVLLTPSSSSSSSSHKTKTPLRLDGRTPLQTRPLRLTFGRSSNRSECTAQYGPSSRCTTVISCDLIPPTNPMDRPNDGVVRINVDMSPMAAMGYENAAPVSTHTSSSSGGDTTSASTSGGGTHPMEDTQKLLTNRILRILERTIVAGGVIDTESLCVSSGHWVWRLNIDVTILDSGGNIVDVAMMATVGALRHYRKPQVDVTQQESGLSGEENFVSYTPMIWNDEDKEPTPLPLHHTPLSLTYALYSDMTGSSTTVAAFLDPTDREELVSNGTITITFNKHGEICSLDFPGGCEMKPTQILQCTKLAEGKCVELCTLLENALSEADDKAGKERMDRLKSSLASSSSSGKNTMMAEVQDGLPYVEQTNDDMNIENTDLNDVGTKQAEESITKAAATEETEEEELYRLEALDYARMHVAAKVKEDDEKKKKFQKQQKKKGTSLMEAMLKSASSTSSHVDSSNPNAVSSNRTMEDDKEFEAYAAAQQQQNTTATTTMTMAIDSDDEEEEEEEVTTLQSEFGTIVSVSNDREKEEEEKPKKKAKVVEMTGDNDDEEEDVDDLAKAVIGKKKKKKKSKKKKGQ
uniref:Uncharacterized protein n=1 Tax=Ditylum brightwellii TaxID=49249 RepID=A0A7S1ZHG2_9STRA